MRVVTVAVLALLMPAGAGAQARKPSPAKKAGALPKPSVDVVRLQVVSAEGHNWQVGTTVVVAVGVQPPFGLVAMDKEKSTLEITDAQGTALAEPEVDWSPDFNQERTVALVDLEAKGLAAAGSPYVAARGTLSFTVATGTKTVKAPNVKFEKGTPVKLGAATVTVGDVDKEGFGDGPIVMFEGTTAVIKSIKAVRAKDAKGAVVEANWSSSGTWHGEDGYQSSYRFKSAGATALSLEFDLWDGLRELPVAVDVKAGVGAPQR